MMRLSCLLCLFALPALAEANLSPTQRDASGAAASLVMAHKLYAEALKTGEALVLVTAIELARGVTLRNAAGWTKNGEPVVAGPGDILPDGPGAPQAIDRAQRLAGDDPALQDLVYDLDAQKPRAALPTVAVAMSVLEAGAADAWRIAFFGEAPAEVAVIGDGAGRLVLRVADADGAAVCTDETPSDQKVCAFTPARNGFFSVTVQNDGPDAADYRLVSN